MQDDYHVIGLMSGTSLDGLDIAYCRFFKVKDQWRFSLKQSRSVDYSSQFRDQLKASVNLSATDLLLLNNEFGRYTGSLVKAFIKDYDLKVDFVASHGHTVFHQPDKGLTYQIGAGQELASHAAQRVICDFRTLDVSLGGHGAPLVPIGDQLLFPEYDFCLNLGGISNASFKSENKRLAFDIAPVNMLLSRILQPLGLPYDDKGQMARKGAININLLNQLNRLEFYQKPFPKSLGFEWFEQEMLPIINDSVVSVEDQLHTAVHHIAQQISNALMPFASVNACLLATGGGTKNVFLIEVLQRILGEKIKVEVPEESIIDFKEAIIFAFMGVLRARGEINCLSSVTGASRDSSGGVIYEP